MRKDLDYYDREAGKVVVRRLPPGRYSVYNFVFGGSMGASIIDWSSGKKFSIPFEIKAGEATYVGNFARTMSAGTPMQKVVGYGGYFVISDKREKGRIGRALDAASGRVGFPSVGALPLPHRRRLHAPASRAPRALRAASANLRRVV